MEAAGRPVLVFDGIDDIVEFDKTPEHSIRRDITLEAWVLCTRWREWSGIVSRVYDTGNTESGYGLLLDKSGGFYFGVKIASAPFQYVSSGPNTLPMNEWHHIAATWDGQQINLYVDGERTAQQPFSGEAIHYDPEHPLALGAYRDNDELYPLGGKLCEVRLWSAARTQEQIRAGMRGAPRADEAQLVGYWPLSEGSGNTASDRSPKGRHGRISGAVWEKALVVEPRRLQQFLLESLQQEVAASKGEVERARSEAQQARQEAGRAIAEAQEARAQAERATAEAEKARAEAERSAQATAQATAQAAAEAEKARAEAERSAQATAQATAEAEKARAEAERSAQATAQATAAQAAAEAEKARAEAERSAQATAQAVAQIEQVRGELLTVKGELTTVKGELLTVKGELTTVKVDSGGKEESQPDPIAGLDSVGHGIYLRPNGPYELKRVLFPRAHLRPLTFKDAERVYEIPQGYEVDDSPPMPASQLLNQVMIEESFDRFQKQMSLDVNMAVGVSAFSVSATTSQASQLRSNEEAYYAVRSSFIPLWAVYLSDFDNLVEELNHAEIPTPFRHENRAAYDRFFERFGSHYVKRAWIGGKAQLFLTILKASGMSKEEIKAGLKASYGSVAKGEANAKMEQSRERLQSSSQCSVAGKGGDELRLAALSSLDEAKYNEWLATIRDNPQTVELEVTGIWTLFRDREKAQTLQDAYMEATVFAAISAAFTCGKTVYFIRGDQAITYDIEAHESQKPLPLIQKWPELGPVGFDRVDAAFSGQYLSRPEGGALSQKIYFFRRDRVVRLDAESGRIDPGYPMLTAAAFPGVDFERIDDVLEDGRECVYFFSGKKYTRFNLRLHGVEEGYPDLVQRRWVGVTFERIDAALYWGNGKVFFFKEDQHIRYDLVTCAADPGYPKQTVGNYIEDWRFFD